MTEAERLAEFAVRASFDTLSETAREQVKIRVLDGLGCAIGAVLGGPVRAIREQIEDFNGSGHCTLIGGGAVGAGPDGAVQLRPRPISRLQRQLSCQGRNLPPQR